MRLLSNKAHYILWHSQNKASYCSLIIQSNRSFGRELVVLLTILCMFGKISVHPWRGLGVGVWRGLTPEHSVSGQTHSGIPRGAKRVWSSIPRYRMFFVQTSTRPPRHAPKPYQNMKGFVSKTTNSLPKVMMN